MEQLAAALPRYPNGLSQAPMLAAADGYYSAGDTSNEFRLLKSAFAVGWTMDQIHEQRLFQFLLERDPDQLVTIASGWNSVGEQATQFALNNGSAALAHAVVQARARVRPPVWKDRKSTRLNSSHLGISYAVFC